MHHTHRDIKDADLRHIMAIELMTFRRLRKELQLSRDDTFFYGAMVGFDTALRRVQMDRDLGKL